LFGYINGILNNKILKTLIGIDFSLNSPAFCVRKGNQLIWGSLTRSERDRESYIKSSKKPYAILDPQEEFNFLFMDKKKMPDDYSEKERIKIDYFQELVDIFWTSIMEICKDEEIVVAMEGLSFSSNGNALIDISMATALLRKKIVDQTGSSNFHVFSPTSVKKFALKGNAKKHELYESLVNLDSGETNLGKFTKILEDNKHEWITGGGNVNKPLDDMIDATYICLYLYDTVGKN